MTEGNTDRVLATAMIVSVGVGTINSVVKYGRPPSARFVIGSGVAYLALAALAEGEPEVAKALAIAVATTVVIGQGDGVFSYVNKYGEADTRAGARDPKAGGADRATRVSGSAVAMPDPYPISRSDRMTPIPGLPATK